MERDRERKVYRLHFAAQDRRFSLLEDYGHEGMSASLTPTSRENTGEPPGHGEGGHSRGGVERTLKSAGGTRFHST